MKAVYKYWPGNASVTNYGHPHVLAIAGLEL
jgi:hypothetical protein